MPITITHIHRPAKQSAVDILTDAFRAYPIFPYVFAESQTDDDTCLRTVIAADCENSLTRSIPIYAAELDGRTAGIAIAWPPDLAPDSPELKAVHTDQTRLIGSVAGERLADYDLVCKAGKPARPHHYLSMLGVAAGFQGRGIGRALVEHIQDVVREHATSAGICLNTEVPANIEIYARLGFRIICEAPYAGFVSRTMWWEA